jgi:hypothetical protein
MEGRIRIIMEQTARRAPKDYAYVDLDDDYERWYWRKRFDCSEQQLREAVRAVGAAPPNVAAWIAVKRALR